jgi:ATP-dependent HslUV protease ATP-binding subunit HslU
MRELTPRQIVEELDRHIIGQHDAKRAVAVAIRNRWRRRRLPADKAREIYPRNIIMSGPTGVGKTEIARRLAQLTGAPFVKVEASKFTEVGYHGRDVESMIRDLVEQGIRMVRGEQSGLVKEKAEAAAEERLLDLLLPARSQTVAADGYTDVAESGERLQHTRERLREPLAAGRLDDREVELHISQKPSTAMFANMGLDQMDPEMSNMLERMMPTRDKRRKVTVREARAILIEQETDKLLDQEKITAEAISRTEEDGIVFLDEIDKVASPEGSGRQGGPDVSRQGVQRDLLPIVEGSTVTTRHGPVRTDHILFVAAGAFHSASVSDLMPELQGRFPIRVELSGLTREDFVRILKEPDNALTKQQQALLSVEGLEVKFDDTAIEAMAELAAKANAMMENIGARRLATIIERVFEEVNFTAPDRVRDGDTLLTITADFVNERVAPLVKDEDLSKFVL